VPASYATASEIAEPSNDTIPERTGKDIFSADASDEALEKVSDYGAELLNSIRGLEPAREQKTLPCWSAHGGWLAWQLQSRPHFGQLAAGNMEHLHVLIYIVTDIEVVALRAVDNALR